MNTKIRLYTTAEALASLINLMIDGDYMIDSVKSIAKLLSDVTEDNDVVELLENYGVSSSPFTILRVSVTGSVFVNCPTPLTRR